MSDIDVNYDDNINSYTLDDFDDSYKYTNDDLPDYSEDPIDVEDEESVTTAGTFSIAGKKKKPKKKKVDKGYRKFKTKDGNVIYFATSMIPGNSIRDAIYGHYFHEHPVGSWHELLFFKVAKTDNCSTQNIDTLFYDNPEQYESHMNVSVDNVTKNIWAEKYQAALKYFKKQQEHDEQMQQEYTTIK